MAEVGMALPLLMVMLVGTIQVGWVLYQDHVVQKIAREGSNLLSRQVTLTETETVIQGAQPYPGAFDPNARLILSVVRLGTGGANQGVPIVFQRHVIGNLAGTSVVGNPPTGSYGGGPNYTALNPDGDVAIRATTALPNGLTLAVATGQSVYVTELYTRRNDIASLAFWGINFPTTFYGSAFF